MPPNFNPDNRAYRRLLALAADHFEVMDWNRENDERPVMLSLVDLDSGDCFTVGLIDSVEDTEPHVLAVFDRQCQMSAYGPFNGKTIAERHAPHLAAAREDVDITAPMRLYSPDTATLPADVWTDTPPQVAAALAHPAQVGAPAAIVALLDRQRHRLCLVGPFVTDAAAADWPLPADVDPQMAHLVVALHPRQPAI